MYDVILTIRTTGKKTHDSPLQINDQIDKLAKSTR